MEFLSWSILGNALSNWLFALLVAVVLLGALSLAKRVLIGRFTAFAGKTANDIDDLAAEILARTNFYLMAVLAVYAGSLSLTFPDLIQYWIGRIALLAILFQVAIWGDALVTHSIMRYQKQHMESETGRVTTMRALSFIVRLVLFSVILLLALDNMGIKVTALITSLGVGSIAVALAIQNILSDLFASLSIALDQPFIIGDFIIVDDCMGTVENIGLKTTRLRSLSGEQLIFSNNDLLKSRIRNYKRMGERRVVFSFGVLYQTKYEALQKIPSMVREIIESQKPTRFDRAHFKEFGDSALNFEVVYYVLSPDYNIYMDIQQAINLTLFQRFEQDGIGFAYPTQTVYLAKE